MLQPNGVYIVNKLCNAHLKKAFNVQVVVYSQMQYKNGSAFNHVFLSARSNPSEPVLQVESKQTF